MSVTPRTFAAVLGGVALLAGLLATLFVSVTGSHAGSLLGSYPCGTVLAPRVGDYHGETLQSCMDALAARGAWGWPLAIGGAIVLAGALVVRARPSQPNR